MVAVWDHWLEKYGGDITNRFQNEVISVSSVGSRSSCEVSHQFICTHCRIIILYYEVSLTNKSFICQGIISSNKLDLFFVTETWLNTDIIPLIEATPPDYAYLHQPRLFGHGGGVAVIYRNILTCSPAPFGTFSTFQFLGFVLNGKLPVLCVVVCKPPNQNKTFLNEFSELLSVVMSRYDRLLILGDFHVCCPTNTLAGWFFASHWLF